MVQSEKPGEAIAVIQLRQGRGCATHLRSGGCEGDGLIVDIEGDPCDFLLG